MAHTGQLIKARAELGCEVMADKCVFTAATVHHRRPRGAGGSHRADTNSAANGLAICPPCHERVERRRSWAYEHGYLLHQTEDPLLVAVWWRGWQWVTLDDAGGMTAVKR